MGKDHFFVSLRLHIPPTKQNIEAIVAAYNESENRSMRIQILSLICEKYSQPELQELIPDISRRQIQNARQRVGEIGAGETKVPKKLF